MSSKKYDSTLLDAVIQNVKEAFAADYEVIHVNTTHTGRDVDEVAKTGWIPITEELPPFDKKVLFRARIKYLQGEKQFKYFDDKLTMHVEPLEYGLSAYCLSNSDYLVSSDPKVHDYCDEYVTHWCEMPVIN